MDPKLSKEEAISKLTENVEVNGDIKLQVINGNKTFDVLVYAVPVKGIDRVDFIYINATTGENEGVHYLN